MAGIKASLAGVPLLAIRDVGWHLKKGVDPYQRTFEIARSDAEKIVQLYRQKSEEGIDLKFSVPGYADKTFSKLHVLSTSPGTHVDRVAILVSDLRWKWNRKWVKRRYNIIRRSGELRLIRDAVGSPYSLQRLDLADDRIYAKWSVKDGSRGGTKAWTAQEVVDDVLLQVIAPDRFVGFLINPSPLIQNLELNDDGPGALRRLKTIVPGIDYFVDADGVVFVDSHYSGDEINELVRAQPPLRDSLLVEYVDLKQQRPKRIHVYFDVEDELRFDFGTTTSSTDDRTLTNVLPLPDPKLVVNGLTYQMGQWIEINDDLLTAWHESRPPLVDGTALPKLTIDELNLTFISQAWYTLYRGARIETDSLWDRRMSLLMDHYRKTFRINRRWIERFYSIRANRASILDPETGTRAPADVLSDYSVRPLRRRIAKSSAGAKDLVIHHVGYHASTASATAAPARVVILDQDVGVFHVNWKLDPGGDEIAIVPGLTELFTDPSKVPKDDPTTQGILWLSSKLKAEFKLAVILTCAPGHAQPKFLSADGDISPSACHRESYDLSAIRGILPLAVERQVQGADGPEWTVHVGGGLETARFAWQDEFASIVDQVYKEGGDTERPRENLVNGESVRELGKAVAAQIYASLASHYEGAHVSTFDPERRPVGRIDRVAHSLDPDGRFLTTIEFVPELPAPDIFTMLPDSVRRVLLKQVQQ